MNRNNFFVNVCLFIIILLAAMLALSACIGEQKCLNHIYGEWEITDSPTCTLVGAHKKVCENCGNINEEKIPPLGHSYGSYTLIKEPTCLQTGILQQICGICNDIKNDTIAQSEHIFEKNTLGLDNYYENNHSCGEERLRWRFCIVCEEKVFTKTGTNGENTVWQHQWEDFFTDDIIATCTEIGSKSRHCLFCDNKADITAVYARHNTVLSSSILPTCTTDGKTVYICTVCNEETTNIIQKRGHKFAYIISKQPNCTQTGEETATCSVCKENDIRTVPIDKNNHIWGDMTVTDYGNCKTLTNGNTETPCTLCEEKKLGTYLYKHDFQHNMLCKNCNAENNLGKFKTQSYKGGCRITEYLSDNIKNLRIPSEIGGMKVVAIYQNVFSRHTELEYIWLPETIVEIGNGAFSNCTSLKELYIPSNAIILGDAILNNCKSLERVVLPYVGSYYTPEDSKYDEQSTNTLGSYFGTAPGEGLTAVKQQDYNTFGQLIETTYYIPTSLNTVYVHGYFLSLQGFKNCTMITSIFVGAMRLDYITGNTYPTGAFIGGTNFVNCPATADITRYGSSKIPQNIFY